MMMLNFLQLVEELEELEEMVMIFMALKMVLIMLVWVHDLHLPVLVLVLEVQVIAFDQYLAWLEIYQQL